MNLTCLLMLVGLTTSAALILGEGTQVPPHSKPRSLLFPSQFIPAPQFPVSLSYTGHCGSETMSTLPFLFLHSLLLSI